MRSFFGLGAVVSVAVLQAVVPAPQLGNVTSVWSVANVDLITRTSGGTDIFGFMPVVPMTIISALLMIFVSYFTPRSTRETISKYFED